MCTDRYKHPLVPEVPCTAIDPQRSHIMCNLKGVSYRSGPSHDDSCAHTGHSYDVAPLGTARPGTSPKGSLDPFLRIGSNGNGKNLAPNALTRYRSRASGKYQHPYFHGDRPRLDIKTGAKVHNDRFQQPYNQHNRRKQYGHFHRPLEPQIAPRL